MTDTAPKRPETIEEFAAQQLARRIDKISGKLHALANTVEAQAARVNRVGGPGLRAYGQIAAEVQHTIMNALPNLSLDALSTDASDADIARAKGE